LVYCSRCGTQNPDTNTNCTNCGAPLYTVGQQYPGSDREHYRRMENECFGLPNGGMIVGIIFGAIIIIVGLGLFLEDSGIVVNFWGAFWPIIIIIFGLLIVLGALFGRRRRYNEPPHSPP
jgi:ribosomal protein L37E